MTIMMVGQVIGSSGAIAEGWHLEDLVTVDPCTKPAMFGDHLLL